MQLRADICFPLDNTVSDIFVILCNIKQHHQLHNDHCRAIRYENEFYELSMITGEEDDFDNINLIEGIEDPNAQLEKKENIGKG